MILNFLKKLRTIEGSLTWNIQSIALTNNGKYIVTESDDYTIKIWDFESGECLRTIEGHTDYIETIALKLQDQRRRLVITFTASRSNILERGYIQLLIEKVECRLIYLPLYSHNLNKIEQCSSWLESRFRKCLDKFITLCDAIEHILFLSSC